jgi:hypothetical protein
MFIKLSSPNYDDNVNKEKIKNLKINLDEVNKIANKKNIIHKKSNFGQMIRGMSMPYVYYLIQTKK